MRCCLWSRFLPKSPAYKTLTNSFLAHHICFHAAEISSCMNQWSSNSGCVHVWTPSIQRNGYELTLLVERASYRYWGIREWASTITAGQHPRWHGKRKWKYCGEETELLGCKSYVVCSESLETLTAKRIVIIWIIKLNCTTINNNGKQLNSRDSRQKCSHKFLWPIPVPKFHTPFLRPWKKWQNLLQNRDALTNSEQTVQAHSTSRPLTWLTFNVSST